MQLLLLDIILTDTYARSSVRTPLQNLITCLAYKWTPARALPLATHQKIIISIIIRIVECKCLTLSLIGGLHFLGEDYYRSNQLLAALQGVVVHVHFYPTKTVTPNNRVSQPVSAWPLFYSFDKNHHCHLTTGLSQNSTELQHTKLLYFDIIHSLTKTSNLTLNSKHTKLLYRSILTSYIVLLTHLHYYWLSGVAKQ